MADDVFHTGGLLFTGLFNDIVCCRPVFCDDLCFFFSLVGLIWHLLIVVALWMAMLIQPILSMSCYL